MEERNVVRGPQARTNELEERLIDFAVRIVKNLPKTRAGRHIAGQMLRSGTSPAPNYGEAQRAMRISFTSCGLFLKS